MLEDLGVATEAQARTFWTILDIRHVFGVKRSKVKVKGSLSIKLG